MSHPVLKQILAGTCLLSCTLAQNPTFWMAETANILSQQSQVVVSVASPQAGALYAVVCDVDSGPVNIFDTQIQLGFTPLMTTVLVGTVQPGANIAQFTVPAVPEAVGLIVYGQAFTIDPAASNSLFRASNGAATTLLDNQANHVFTMNAAAGYTGTFVPGSRQLLAAIPTPVSNVSTAESPWLLGTGPQPPSYGEPIVAQMLPFGTDIALEYRGATSFSGNEATHWSSSPSIADGLRFLQFRATFVASQLTGARPILTNIVVPHL